MDVTHSVHDVQDTRFVIWKGCVRFVDILYQLFDIQICFVVMVDVLCMYFKIQKSYFRMVIYISGKSVCGC